MGAAPQTELPSRLKILDWGRNGNVRQIPVLVNGRTLAELPKNQRARGFAKVALDFEHNTMPGAPEFERSHEPRAVAAFGTVEVVAGRGVFLTDLQWTPAGRAAATDYRGVSPSAELAPDGTVLFVHSAALTRMPAIKSMTFAAASRRTTAEIFADQVKGALR